MGCHYKCLIYTRMLFYLFTIAIHMTNIIVLLMSFTKEAMLVQGVRNLYETQFLFFTSWNLGFQIAYAAFALFCDWMSLRDTEKKPALPEFVTDFRDKVFTVIVWPCGLMVSTYFWAFYAYDRNLLYPEYFDLVVSPTSNHIMHSLIALIVMLEVVMYPRRKPERSAGRLCCILGLEALYVCVLYYVHFTKGIWIYPVFSQLNQVPICLLAFLTLTGLYLIVLYYAQFFVSKIILKCREKIGERFCKACRK